MRLVIFSLLLASTVAGASAAQESQISRMVVMSQEAQPKQLEAPRDRYTEELMALKKKLVHQTQEDGGKLSPEHQASIQKELDALNRRHGKTAPR